MAEAHAMAAPGPTGPLRPTAIQRRDPGPRDVVIAIRYCGVCHSDIHTARGEWAAPEYPIVVGHEITGVVEAVGDRVARHTVGDRVGVGVMVDSCRACPRCRQGDEQYCLAGHIRTYGSRDRDGSITAGGYATQVVVDEDFVLAVPDPLPLDAAAPLLCAGITMYSPLRHWAAGPGRRVAVLGLGGLGHLGVRLAAAMGAHVTVLSHSPAKQQDAARLGADDFRTVGPAGAADLAGSFDLIVNTVAAAVPLEHYLDLLRVDGTFVQVGAPEQPLVVPPFALIDFRRRLCGSLIGSIRETQDMLDFCAEHSIVADIETVSADELDDAWDKVVDSRARYRYVLDASTLRPPAASSPAAR